MMRNAGSSMNYYLVKINFMSIDIKDKVCYNVKQGNENPKRELSVESALFAFIRIFPQKISLKRR